MRCEEHLCPSCLHRSRRTKAGGMELWLSGPRHFLAACLEVQSSSVSARSSPERHDEKRSQPRYILLPCDSPPGIMVAPLYSVFVVSAEGKVQYMQKATCLLYSQAPRHLVSRWQLIIRVSRWQLIIAFCMNCILSARVCKPCPATLCAALVTIAHG